MEPYILLKANTIGTCSWNYRSPIPSGYMEDELDDTQSQGKRDDVMDYYDSTPVTHPMKGVHGEGLHQEHPKEEEAPPGQGVSPHRHHGRKGSQAKPGLSECPGK